MRVSGEGGQFARWRTWLILSLLLVAGLTAAAVVVIRPNGAPAVTVAPDCSAVPDARPVNTTVPPGNPIEVLRRGWLPSFPEVEAEPQILGLRRYETIDQYMSRSHLVMPEAMRDAMAAHDLVVTETIGFEAGASRWGAEAFQLGSPAKAAAFARRVLLAACEARVASRLAPVLGLEGATSYLWHSWDFAVLRGTLVLGDTVVLLNGCLCQPSETDPRELLDRWIRDVQFQMRSAVG